VPSQAIQLFGALGDRYDMADSLVNLGDTYAAADDPDWARTAWRRAAVILEELGVPTAPLRSKLVPVRDAPSTQPA
jgi:hypothetical protein